MPARKRTYKAHARRAMASAVAMPARKSGYKAHSRRATSAASAMPLCIIVHTKRVPGKQRRPQAPCLCVQDGMQSAYPARDGVRKRPAFVYNCACKAHALRATSAASALPLCTIVHAKRVPCAQRRQQSPCLRAQECIQSACSASNGVHERHACAQEGIQSAYPVRASDLNRHTHARLSTNTFAWKSPSSGSPNSSATS